jgi:hypothetical protein
MIKLLWIVSTSCIASQVIAGLEAVYIRIRSKAGASPVAQGFTAGSLSMSCIWSLGF